MFEIAEYIGIVAFAMSGFFIATRNKLDFLGVLISVFLTALGGGIIRDVIVDKTPYTFSHNTPALIIVAVMILLVVFKFHKKESIENKPLFILSDSIGLISFSITGALIALEHNLNLTGVLALSFITAVGGGIIRDVIVDKTPYTFSHNTPALIIVAVMILLVVFKFHKKESIENKPLFILSDSIGLISFSITGALIALEHDLNLTGVLALSFITAVGGGIIRDVIINEIPFVLKTGFYGTIALLIGLILYSLNAYEMMDVLSLSIVFILGVILRLIAYYNKWAIPMI